MEVHHPAIPGAAPAAPPLWYAALAGMVALLVGLGFGRFGYAPLIPALIHAHWFDAGQAAYLGATNLAGYLLGAALARRLGQRLPVNALLRGSLVVTTLSFLACALPWGFAWYFLWRLASGATGALLMVLAVPKILDYTPAAKRGRVAGTVFTGVGLGVTLAGTLVPWLASLGVPQAWLSFAAASALLTALVWRGFPPGDAMPAAAAPVLGAAHAPAARVLLRPPILLLLLAYCAYAIGFVPHTVFWVDFIARGLGRGLGAGGANWVLFGIAAACGPLATGLMAERIGVGRSLQVSLLAMGISVALPLWSTAPWALWLSSLGVGSVAAGIVSLASVRVGELAPGEPQRMVWAAMTFGFSILYAATAYAFSFLFAHTGSYVLLFRIGAAALVLGALMEAWGARWQARGY